MNYIFRKAEKNDADQIWVILQEAIELRKNEGSTQWQDGYPNLDVIINDIAKAAGYVLTAQDAIIGYCMILVDDEPEYANIRGKWITDTSFVVFHRVAISKKYLGKGLAQLMLKFVEKIAVEKNIYSIKADTNFDNFGMLRIFEKLGYIYCGEVTFRGNSRKAFEKNLQIT